MNCAGARASAEIRASAKRFACVGHGEYSGFETARTLEALNRRIAECLDLVLVLLFHGIGPGFTGDLFIHWLDEQEDWSFHRTRWVAEVSRFFGYKVERQVRDGVSATSPILEGIHTG